MLLPVPHGRRTHVLFAVLATVVLSQPEKVPPYPYTQPCKSEPLKSSLACDHTADLDARIGSLISQIPKDELAALFIDKALGIPSLNIPPYNWWSEALHGVSRCPYQQGGATPSPDAKPGDRGCCFADSTGVKKCPTSFPAGITTGCTFNKTLMRAIGTAVGTEARVASNAGQASLTFWTPNVNIFRDPRWGRGQETPGEDPTVNSDYAEQFVSGFQNGEDSDPRRIKASACCKHYAGYSLENWGPDGPGGATVDRHHFNAVITEQDLADTYYPPFTSCANRGNASGVMCSYNAVNGVPSCASKMLLTEKLRDKWGFDGYITSDAGAVSDVMNTHNFTDSNDTTCTAVLEAGMDNNAGGWFTDGNRGYGGQLASAIADGSVTTAVWQAALRNMLRVQMRLGMFDPDSTQPYRQYASDRVDTPGHRQLALEAAEQGVTLVKNIGGTLPLSSASLKIALLGPHANATTAMQSNYHGTAPYLISPAQGLEEFSNAVMVVQGATIAGTDTTKIPDAVKAATSADATVLIVGLDGTQEGEGHDRWALGLPGVQDELLEKVAAASKKPITLVVIAGGMVDLSAAKANPKVCSHQSSAISNQHQQSATCLAQTHPLFDTAGRSYFDCRIPRAGGRSCDREDPLRSQQPVRQAHADVVQEGVHQRLLDV
jgi:beta-glucosidase-like glycosyl hydrolase